MTLPLFVLRLALVLAVLAPAVALGAPAAEITPANTLESAVLAELNAVRSANGVRPLRLNARLSAAASQHSREMVEAGYFGHESSDGGVFWQRIKRFYTRGGKRPWIVGENLLWQAASSVSAKEAVREWLRSPGHRENLLKPAFREVGLAAIHATASGVFGNRRVLVLTADFGRR